MTLNLANNTNEIEKKLYSGFKANVKDKTNIVEIKHKQRNEIKQKKNSVYIALN